MKTRIFAVGLAVGFVVALDAAAQPAEPAPPKPAATDAGGGMDARLDAQQADIDAQDARMRELEKRIGSLTKELAASKAAAGTSAPITPTAAPGAPLATPETAPKAAKESFFDTVASQVRGISLTGYVQAQYENHQNSEDQQQQGGALLNQDRFLIRRSRLRVEREWRYASAMIEIDGNTVRGPAFSLFHAEASVLYRGAGEDAPTPPLVKLTMGLFDAPFGYEMVESPRVRPFMERSLASRSFFPAEPDVGVRLSGALGWFRYAVAVVNGEPKDEAGGFALVDPNGSKDIVGRVGALVAPADGVQISAGLSLLSGQGFHKGTDATKNGLQWHDTNENGQIDLGELLSTPGTAATPAQNYSRWLVGADYMLRFKTPAGATQIYGEVSLGSNMDRGLFIADPIQTSINTRELGYYVALLQDVTPYGLIGFRAESYDPNADFLNRQGGVLLKSSQTIHTYSPIVGLVLPDRARLLFQYDIIRNLLGLDPTGVPANLKENQYTLRLQVTL